MLLVLVVVGSLILAVDVILYSKTPYNTRSCHWWSYLPLSGFYAYYKYYHNQQIRRK